MIEHDTSRMTDAPATQEAVAALAQSRGGAASPSPPSPSRPWRMPLDEGHRAGYGTRYTLGPNVTRAPPARMKRTSGEPLYRPLRVYALDPAASRLEGAFAELNVPYERLAPGPVGSMLRIDDVDGT